MRMFPNELCCRERINVRYRIVLSTANQIFAVEYVIHNESRVRCQLCHPQRIRFSLLNCVVRSESCFHCRIMFSAPNQVFPAEFVLSSANQVFAAELCCPH